MNYLISYIQSNGAWEYLSGEYTFESCRILGKESKAEAISSLYHHKSNKMIIFEAIIEEPDIIDVKKELGII